MTPSSTISIDIPIASVSMVNDTDSLGAASSQSEKNPDELKAEKESLVRVCQSLEEAANKLGRLHSEIFSKHREQIARLSVEIAEKILLKEIDSGHYDIGKIIQAALETAPSQQEVVVNLNPNDMQQYQQTSKDENGSSLTGIKLVANPNIGPAQCIVETDKGMIEYLIEEHLKQISEALKSTGQ